MDEESSRWNAAVTTSAGITLGVLATLSVVTWHTNIDAKDWLQFIGTLIGAGATVGAGAAAWSAVQRQLRYKEAAAKDVVDRKLREFIEMCDVAWRAVDRGINEGGNYIAIARKYTRSLNNPVAVKLIATIENVSSEMNAIDRDQLEPTLHAIGFLRDQITNAAALDEENEGAWRSSLYGTRNQLSHLCIFLNRYSSEIASIFKDRIHEGLPLPFTYEEAIEKLEADWAAIESRFNHNPNPYPADPGQVEL